MGVLFTHKNGDFSAISVTERGCAAPISRVESHVEDRCSYYTVADQGEKPGGSAPPPPLVLDQTEAPRAAKHFFEDPRPRPVVSGCG